jgi:agmatinase
MEHALTDYLHSDHEFPYLSASGFLKSPPREAARQRRFCVAGVNWDGSVSNRPGARHGPSAVRRASHMLCDGIHPLFDVTPLDQLCDAGDLPLPNTAIEPMRAKLQPMAESLIREHYMVWIGGDHSITLPLLRAYRAVLGRPLALIHFDAHCDTWTHHSGEPSGHGTWVYEAIREGLVMPECTMQIGIRSSGDRAAREYVNQMGGRVFTARELRGAENPNQLRPVLDEVRRRHASADFPPVYLSFDIDALDPAFAPGTGTPEAGGLTSAQTLTLFEELADLDWVGMDLVEVAPAYDHAEITSLAAASLIWTHLCGIVAQGNPVPAHRRGPTV